MTALAMTYHRPARMALAALALAGFTLAACGPEATTVERVEVQIDETCDRACLIDLLDRYLTALVMRNPTAAPLADNFRSTENAASTPAGQGVWSSVTALGALQRRYADPETGQAGYVGLVGEGNDIAIVSLRIRAQGQRIAEAEWVIARDDTPLYNPEGFTTNPPPDFPAPTSASGREASIAAARSYFDGIEAADAADVIAYEDCFRVENGTWMVGRMPDREPPDPAEARPGFNIAMLSSPLASCIGGFQNFRGVTRDVTNRRFFYDEMTGVVWAQAVFERDEDARDLQGDPLAWVYVANIFRIEDGQIRGIYSITYRLPPHITGPGWASTE